MHFSDALAGLLSVGDEYLMLLAVGNMYSQMTSKVSASNSLISFIVTADTSFKGKLMKEQRESHSYI